MSKIVFFFVKRRRIYRTEKKKKTEDVKFASNSICSTSLKKEELKWQWDRRNFYHIKRRKIEKSVCENPKIIARQNVLFHTKIKRIEKKEDKKKGVRIRHNLRLNMVILSKVDKMEREEEDIRLYQNIWVPPAIRTKKSF